LWVTRLPATADTVPVTYLGRNGKQYVVIAAGGTNRFRMLAKTADQMADALIAFALPDRQTAGIDPQSERPAPNRAPERITAPARPGEARGMASGPALPDGEGKELALRMCTTCHGTAVFATMRMGRVGWENEVAAMIERGAIGTEEEIRKLVDYLTKNFAPK
jgi:quinoprotein glucose dehydrogenase